MKKTILVFGIAVVALSSCSKDSSTTPDPVVKTKTQLIQQKWIMDKQYVIDFDGVSTLDTTFSYSGSGGDYIEFSTNGKAYTSFLGELDSTTYHIINDDSIKIDDVSFRITTLTETDFDLLSTDTDTDGSYEKVILELKK